MITRIVSLLFVVCLPLQAKELTAKDILIKNKDAIVQIFVNKEFSGTGFIISKDGIIATASHVVTTRESGGSEFYPQIDVVISRDSRDHFARPLLPVTLETKSHDVALLKIEAADLPFVNIGNWDEIHETDSIAVIASLRGYGNHLIVTGMVSGKGEGIIPDLPRVRTIILQAPVRNGFSGSPVFSNSTGNVIGVVTTKVFGINRQLETIGEKARTQKGQSAVSGIDIGGTISELVDALHFQLISGLGSAVDITYVKELQTEVEKADKK
jgi:hypothetical protein